MKSMTAWENQSLKVDVYILKRTLRSCECRIICLPTHLASELTPSLSKPPKSRFPVLQRIYLVRCQF
jgi:hypothetical protein